METGTHLVFYVNQQQWESLPPSYQSAFEVAARDAHIEMLAAYDAKNPPALQRLLANGAELRRFPDDVLLKAYEIAHQIYAEEAEKNQSFKKIYTSMMAFQDRSDAWWGSRNRRWRICGRRCGGRNKSTSSLVTKL